MSWPEEGGCGGSSKMKPEHLKMEIDQLCDDEKYWLVEYLNKWKLNKEAADER